MDEWFHTLKIFIFLKFICKFDRVTIKFAEKAFWRPWKTYLKVMWSLGYFDKKEKKQRSCCIIYEDTLQRPSNKQRHVLVQDQAVWKYCITIWTWYMIMLAAPISGEMVNCSSGSIGRKLTPIKNPLNPNLTPHR